MTLVSLFAGVGGFDLGFERAGFKTVGQCEIDPHAASVLTRHWPDVPKHDDVTTLDGMHFGPADVITFGSPCQDLSVAGKRAGLDGERSGLFLEAVRFIREMLEETNGQYPRWAVWENVPGAYSSNGGADFAAVLESLVGGEVRRPSGGWANAGVAFGPLGSAEWRTLDSQYFGVPQRRRRIFLVYHPGGVSAGEVLLEPDGVPGHPPSRRSPGEGITGALTGGAGSSSAGNPDDNRAQAGFLIPEVMPTMRAGGTNDTPSKGQVSGDTRDEYIIPVPVETAPTVLASWGHNGYSSPRGDGTDPIVPVAFENHGHSQWREGVGTVRAEGGDAGGGSETVLAFVASDYSTGAYEPADKAEALTTSADRTRAAPIAFALRGRDDGATPEVSGDRTNALRGAGGGSSRDYVAYGVVSKGNGEAFLTPEQHMSLTSGGGQAGQGYPAVMAPVAFPIDDGRPMEKRQNGLGIGAANAPSYTLDTTGAQSVATPYAVRRLTPKECCRLQGFPDDWTALDHEGREIADTHRYRMMGNAVSVPVAEWIAHRIKEALS